MQMRRGGSIGNSKVLEVNTGHLEFDQKQADFKNFSKTIDKWAFIVCSIYIMMFVTIYTIVALSK